MGSLLRAPFPYFGYKGKISAEVWKRLGNPPNYVEPFAGSLAVLLQRPQKGRREVVNDKAGGLVNFWRAVQDDPGAVARYAVWINSESDLHARNAAVREELAELTERLEGNPEFYDPKLAGWWAYVQCMAIGEAAYGKGPWVRSGGKLIHKSRADGIRRTIPCDSDRGIQKWIPFHGNQGIMARREWAADWLRELAERLYNVRILCGDWSRACKPSYTTSKGLTGVFLDPPYVCDYDCYKSSESPYSPLCQWCVDNGPDPKLRIALCGYEGTLPIDLTDHGWEEFAWKAPGGRVTTGSSSDENRKRERIWFSPHCVRAEIANQLDLF